MRIWLLRHAESEWNAAGRWQGHGDPPLSRRGRAAAAARADELAARVHGERPVEVFCSDLGRAVETAAAVVQALAVAPAVQVPALRELDVGTWTGLSRVEIEAKDPDALAAFEAEQPGARPGGGETRAEIGARAHAAVEALAASHPDADLLLVVHLGVVRALVPGSSPDHLELVCTELDRIRRGRPLVAAPR